MCVAQLLAASGADVNEPGNGWRWFERAPGPPGASATGLLGVPPLQL